jgi:hypothetical protein
MSKTIQYKPITAIVFVLMLLQLSSVGQLRIDSPYSRFGLGDVNSGFNAYQSSMGGVGYGVKDPHRISTINPAAYANIDSGSFVFNAAFKGIVLNTKTASASGGSNYFNLDYLKFALPVTKWWRTGGGLLPYSTVGYNVSTYGEVDSIGTVKYSYLGDGGITNVYWGNSFRITKKLAIGANLSYLFGTNNLRRQSQLMDNPVAFKYRITNSIKIKNIYFDFGIQYNTSFGKDKKYFLGIGAIYAPQQTLNGEKSSLAITYTDGAEGHEYIKDTIIDIPLGSGDIIIPQKIGGGFSIGKTKKWMFAADFTFNEFSKYSIFDENQDLDNSMRYNIGGQYYFGNYLVNLGFMYNDSYLTINETKINNFGISFGVGFPLRNNKSTVSSVDLGFEFGRRGTTINNLIQQDYIKFTLGINIRNTWFRRAKYL